jgi:hypothetical protein
MMLISLLLTADLQLIFIGTQELVPYGKGVLFCFATQFHLYAGVVMIFSVLVRQSRSAEKSKKQPARKEIVTLKVQVFILMCVTDGNDSYDILQYCK